MLEYSWILREGMLCFGTCTFVGVTYEVEENLASQEGLCCMELSR